ncbi:MAG: hypothetical protein QN152_06005 [Armatimonadota bacterium]|nr:hypothetical protein [Armatimonadota bacterium]MDR7463550.1 hypothetical protein [Armatimonadota bacterium]MDR7470615.1 hypothetical protein [Armatimonadota bacterium]MDR7473868.1 hypothetical protein [Armatimonadota bacterium]MDR7539073.1 hypothetical protein [Armatimonadota bacterium]
MYLDLGRQTVVAAGEIVTILDAKLARMEANRRFLEQASVRGFPEGSFRRCRALVVTTRGIYPSAISPQGLARRLTGGRIGGG